MTARRAAILGLLAAWISACRAGSAGAQPTRGAPVFTVIPSVAPTRPREHQVHPISISLAVAGVETRAEGLQSTLELRLERRREWVLPVRARLFAPAGVTVEGGFSTFTYPEAPAGTTHIARVVLRSRGVPPGDFRIEYESVDGASGLRGHAEYRFGRPDPVTPPLVLSPQSITGNGVLLTPVMVR